MSATKTGNSVHDNNCLLAETTRQVAVAAAGSNMAAAKSAEISYFRACRSSALANGTNPTQYILALLELGQGGQ